MHVRGNFAPLLRPGLTKDFRDEYLQHAEQFSRFMKVGTQDRAEVERADIAGLPRMVKRGESESTTYLNAEMGPRVIFVDDEYALGFIVSKKLMEDDLYNRSHQNAKWLGRSVRLTEEHAAAAFLDDAVAGTLFTGRNGEPLLSATHALLNSPTTVSNIVPNNPQLGVTGLQAMYDLAGTLVDNNDEPIVTNPNMLIVDPTNRWVAAMLKKSELEPFTADNQINTLRTEVSFDFMVNNYMTPGDKWFAFDTTQNDAHFLYRRKPRFTDWFDPDTDNAHFKADMRINPMFFDWRGWYGSFPT